jgi:putative ATP-dependent endonuclease of the OLD family
MAREFRFAGVAVGVRNFKCFGSKTEGFDEIKPINVIIGRNNSGKSALVDLIDLCVSKGKFFEPTKHTNGNEPFEVQIVQKLDEISLGLVFPHGTQGGGVPAGEHGQYGKRFIGQSLTRSYRQGWRPERINGPNFDDIQEGNRAQYVKSVTEQAIWPFEGTELIRVAAERDVRPELRNPNLVISENGDGTTNLIQGFINYDSLPRSEVELHLLRELNQIFVGDANFLRISSRENAAGDGKWEIFLLEESKGEIRLSQSGSSLKSIFIILSFLRLLPKLRAVKWTEVIFSVEEPENNLHPALLRRLLNFLAEKRAIEGFTLLITTHSPVSIDWSSQRPDSQIIHVTHDGHVARATMSRDYLSKAAILDDLDIRASDLMQANGVIWVEGPSDRIYIRKWLELISEGKLKEGVHYNTIFYGGKLLSHLEATTPNEAQKFVSILSINRNAAILIDSDRHQGKTGINPRKPRMNINETKTRIKNEVSEVNGFVWVTEGREVENYIPNRLVEKIVGAGTFDAGIYDQISEHQYLKKYRGNKLMLAHAVTEAFARDDLKSNLDLEKNLLDLVSHIERWNNIENHL